MMSLSSVAVFRGSPRQAYSQKEDAKWLSLKRATCPGDPAASSSEETGPLIRGLLCSMALEKKDSTRTALS